MASDALLLVGQYVDELGGEARLTAGQRVHLKRLYRATVALDAAFARVLRDGDAEAFDRVGSLLADERATLAALGLQRVAREVPSLGEYLATRSSGDGPSGAAPPLDVTRSRALERESESRVDLNGGVASAADCREEV
jgi:hypothetical protein